MRWYLPSLALYIVSESAREELESVKEMYDSES